MTIKHWHVIFVMGGYEETITHKINEVSKLQEVEAFLPKVQKAFRRKGQVKMEEHLLFKNYVFVQTNLDFKAFNVFLMEHIRPITGFIKLLKHDNEGTESLYPQERDFLERFTNKAKVIEQSIGFIKGDKIVILQGPLAGYESNIKRINRHKRTALLEVSMFGEFRDVEVGLEVISKTD